jgi:hypothetical protein
MKKPHRGQIILHCRDSSRLEQTGQNWQGNSSTRGGSTGCGACSLIVPASSICPAPLAQKPLDQTHMPSQEDTEAQAEAASGESDHPLEGHQASCRQRQRHTQ